MSKPLVIVTSPLAVDIAPWLEDIADCRTIAPANRQELLSLVKGASALLTMLSDKVDAELMDAAGPQLVCCANYAVGFNNMDLEGARTRGVVCTNTPDVLTLATAELAWALLLSASRHVSAGDRMMRAGKFHGWEATMLLGSTVTGSQLGIIGPGRIGSAMARMARGFDMPVVYFGRSAHPEFEKETGARRVSLEELLQTSDFVSLHCPYTPETHHLLNRDMLSLMKPTAVLVNTARGACIDEAALVEALKEGRIAAAGLDVYEAEPAMAPGLAELDNVILLPHLGSATLRARTDMARMAAENIRCALLHQKAPQALN
nr:D-glycerate dehydrogenase [bacterium]